MEEKKEGERKTEKKKTTEEKRKKKKNTAQIYFHLSDVLGELLPSRRSFKGFWKKLEI